MKTVIYTIFFLMFFSCATQYERGKFSYNRSENPWITAYKQDVFYSCLQESYRNDSIFILMRKEDMFNGLGDFSMIDRARLLGKRIANGILSRDYLIDADHINMKYPPKPISATCLRFYESRELDSIARAEYFSIYKKKPVKYKIKSDLFNLRYNTK